MKGLIKRFKFLDYLTMFGIVGFIVAQTYFEMEFISYTERLLDLVKEHASANKFWELGLLMLGIAVLIFVLILIVNILTAYFSSKIARDYRRDIFIKVNSFSKTEINKFSTASLITRSTNDVNQVQRTLMMTLKMVFTAPFMAMFAIIRITNTNVTLTWTTIAFVGVMLLMLITLIILVLPKFIRLQSKIDKLNLVTRENLTGVRVVRAYNAEDYQIEKFEDANNDLSKTHFFINKLMSVVDPGMNLIMSMLILSVFWIGASLINNGVSEYATIATFSQYAMHVVMSFMFITLMFVMVPRGIVSLKRINAILDEDVTIKDGKVENTPNIGLIEFKNVSFTYPDAPEKVLEDISFTAEPGKTVAFIGATGSGKSTLINLIPRFYDTTEGEVLVDGVNVKDYKLETLRGKIGFVPQKANLFSGDIEYNMHMSNKSATKYDIRKALQIAQCSFIEELPDGYTHTVDQGGKNFSGGQKQRLSIARAIVRNPKIYIFDDSFSALDFKTDKVLRAELKKNTTDATILIVAQRISTIQSADEIIVLDKGKIVGRGTHKQLLESNEVYREIYNSQTKKVGE